MSAQTHGPYGQSAADGMTSATSPAAPSGNGLLPWLPPLRQWSLRLRLCMFFLLFMVIAWALAALLAWKECKDYIDEFYDSQQMLFAKRLASANLSNLTDRLPSTKAALRGDTSVEKGAFEDDALAFAVFSIDGEAVLTDGDKGDHIMFQNKVTGFVESRLYRSRKPWRIVWLPSLDGGFLIAVGQEIEYRADMALDMLKKQLFPWMMLVPVLFVGFFWILSRELSPLRDLTHQLECRQADDATALRMRRIPPELQFIVNALNSLFLRIGALLTRERAFISDAAHELRTPLTALRIQAEVAHLAVNDREALEHALEWMLRGIDKSTQLVEQLLTLSRLEALEQNNPVEFSSRMVDWLSMLDEQVLEHRHRAEKKGITITCSIASEPAPFNGYPVMVALLLRNLFDNAVKYTPENGAIQVYLAQHSLTIENSGPGVPDSFVPHLGERFARPPGQESPGSGLGLSIAKRAAALNKLGLSLQNRMGGAGFGFVARISFQNPV